MTPQTLSDRSGGTQPSTPARAFEDRAYQQQATNDLRDALRDLNSVILYAPTGSGKTKIACDITAKAVQRKRRVLFMGDSTEIIEQTAQTMRECGVSFGIIQAGRQRDARPWESVHIGTIQTLRNRHLPPKDLVWVDECLSGESLVQTDVGHMRIDDPSIAGRQVLSFNERNQSWEYRQVLRWLPRGSKAALCISTGQSSLVCTANHPIMTARGWVAAGSLRVGDRIASPSARAGAVANSSRRRALTGADRVPALPTGSGTRTSRDTDRADTLTATDWRYGSNQYDQRASADAWRRWMSRRASLRERGVTHPYSQSGARLDSRTGTEAPYSIGNVQRGGALLLVSKNWDSSQGHSSEISPSGFRIQDPTIQGSRQRTAYARRRGPTTRRAGYLHCDAGLALSKIGDSASSQRGSFPPATRDCSMSIGSFDRRAEKKSRGHGLISSRTKVSRGGTWMTDRFTFPYPEVLPLFFTPKATRTPRASCWPNGSQRRAILPRLDNASDGSGNRHTRRFTSPQAPPATLSPDSENSKRQEWNTNFQTVLTIQQDTERDVFDLEVKGNHNFVANGLLVHNCHLARAKSWHEVIQHYIDSGAKVVGLSATPCRLDGKGLGKLFRKIVYCPSIEQLTAAGYLCPVRIFAPPAPKVNEVQTVAGDFNKAQLAAVMDKAKLIGDAVEHYGRMARGRLAILSASSIEHSKHLAAAFSAAGVPAAHCDGDTPTEERRRILKSLPAREIMVLTQVDICGKGWDCREVSVGIDCRPTQSLARWLQFVGRILRTAEGKRDAILLDHSGNVHRFGFPDEERAWSLDEAATKKRDKDEAPPVTTCRQCFATFRPGPSVCPYCGAPIEKQERRIDVEEGALEELVRKAARAEEWRAGVTGDKRRLHFEELRRIGVQRGYSSWWSCKRFEAIYGSLPPQEWQDAPVVGQMSFANPEWNKVVSSVLGGKA